MRIVPALLLAVLARASLVAAPVSFNRDVRPILSDRCYGCHGPDANKGRKAGLRLDELAGATKELKSGERAIIPGDVENSEMVFNFRTDGDHSYIADGYKVHNAQNKPNTNGYPWNTSGVGL